MDKPHAVVRCSVVFAVTFVWWLLGGICERLTVLFVDAFEASYTDHYDHHRMKRCLTSVGLRPYPVISNPAKVIRL